jgi:hypothetical protein
MKYLYVHLQKIKIILFLGIAFLSNACLVDFRPEKPTVQITQLNYTINLTDQDEQGFYLVQPKQTIILSAQASGPYQAEAQWATTLVKAIDNKDSSVVYCASQDSRIQVRDLGLVKRPKSINEQQRFYVTIQDAGSARQYKINCFFAGNQKTIDGVNLFQGENEFKLKVIEIPPRDSIEPIAK